MYSTMDSRYIHAYNASVVDYIQNYNARLVRMDPVNYPYQRPSAVELAAAPQDGYHFRCQLKCKEMVIYLKRTFTVGNLRAIISDHVRYLNPTIGLKKPELSLIVITYMMLLLLNDEQKEYKRMIRIMKDKLRDCYLTRKNLDWWPILDYIVDGDRLVQMSQELFGKVEWPAVRPLLNVTPLSPLVCLDLLPADSHAEVRFRISKPRPTDPKCRYFLFWYRLKSIPPDYNAFISNNQSRIHKMISVGNDQFKESINSDSYFSSSPMNSLCLFEHFSSKIPPKSAVQSQTLEQAASNSQTNEETTNNSLPTLEYTNASSSLNETNRAGNQILKLNAEDLEISTFHGHNVTVNQHYKIRMNHGHAVDPIQLDMLFFNGQVNTLTVRRIGKNKNLKPHILQIVEATVDPEEWRRLYGAPAMPTVSAEEVKKVFFSNKTKNDEIESLDITLPLKCPLTMVRLRTPVRGSSCRHISCFDSSSIPFISRNARFLRCPNCNKDLLEADLVVDGFVQDILNKTEGNVDEVIIDSKTGEWRKKSCCSEILESSGEEQLMPKIPRIDESFIADDPKITFSNAPPGSSIANAIVLD